MELTIKKTDSFLNDSKERITIRKGRHSIIRDIIAGTCFFVIFSLAFLYEMDKDYLLDDSSFLLSNLKVISELGYLQRSYVSGVLFLLASLCGFETRNKKDDCSSFFLYLWLLMNATFIIAGLSHDIQEGYLFSQIIVMIAVPVFYFSWVQSGRLKELYTVFSTSIMLFTLLFICLCLIWFPYGDLLISGTTETESILHVSKSTVFFGENRYMGMMPHPSRIAHFATPGAISSLYLCFVWKGWKTIIPGICLGFSLAISFLAVSRASVLSILIAFVCFLIMYFKTAKSGKQLLIVVLVAVLSLCACFAGINRGEDNYHLFSNRIPVETAYAESDNTDETDEALEGEGSDIGKRFFASGTLNDITSGRIGIWLTFLKKLNYSGHDVRYYYPLRVKDPDSNTYYFFAYPHNVALDYAYRCGIPTGVLYVLIEFMAFLYCIKKLFSRKTTFDDGEAFAVMGIMAFLLTGNVESVNHVFTRIILVVYYLSLVPLLKNSKEKQQ